MRRRIKEALTALEFQHTTTIVPSGASMQPLRFARQEQVSRRIRYHFGQALKVGGGFFRFSAFQRGFGKQDRFIDPATPFPLLSLQPNQRQIRGEHYGGGADSWGSNGIGIGLVSRGDVSAGEDRANHNR